ncbi:unnamed protein product [Brachionus calyciflorus]|uniref:Uncharacterized protein n=1 Tax=Brachionus calyciflorus TaxID=104777 RepID=A0A813YBZ5_9BILA|nr:unnamed protein product [Brachionus calyciflorus]
MSIIRKFLNLDSSFINKLETVTTTGKSIWSVTLKEPFNFRELIGKSITINDQSYQLENAEEPIKNDKTFTYKFYGLKSNFDKDLIEKHLVSEGVHSFEIVDIYDEFMKDVEFRPLKTGTKLRFDAFQNADLEKYNNIFQLTEQKQGLERENINEINAEITSTIIGAAL